MSLERIIEEGPSESLVFVENPPSKDRDYPKTVSALANGIGGTIIFGVSPEGGVVGIPEQKLRPEISEVWSGLSNARLTDLRPDIGLSSAYGKTVIVLDIEKGNRKPHFAVIGGKGRTFVRKGKETVEADREAVIRLSQGAAFDGGILALSPDSASLPDGLAGPGPDGPIPSLLTPEGPGKAGGTEAGCAATNAEALMAANPFPHAYFRCVRYVSGGDVPKETVDFRGSLKAQVSSVTDYAMKHFSEGMDPEAVREVVCNAAVHRDYGVPEPVTLTIRPGKLTVSSPGVSPGRLGLAASGRSYPRNPTLQAMMMSSGIASEWGSGLQSIMETCPETEISEAGGRFTITIPATARERPLTKNELATVREIKKDRYVTAREVSDRTGIPFGTVRRIMNNLRTRGVIEREGSRKTGVWVIS